MTSSMPCLFNSSRFRVMIGAEKTGMSGLGNERVTGCSLLPNPAARIMAFIDRTPDDPE